MLYTSEMFEEDTKIFKAVYKKSFNTYDFNELYSFCSSHFQKIREKYDNKNKYFTFAYICIYRLCICCVNRSKQKTFEISNLSLDANMGNDTSEDFTLLSLLSYNEDFDKNFNYVDLLQKIKNVLEIGKGSTFSKHMEYFYKCGSIMETCKHFKVSKQCISQQVIKFRKLLKNELNKDSMRDSFIYYLKSQKDITKTMYEIFYLLNMGFCDNQICDIRCCSSNALEFYKIKYNYYYNLYLKQSLVGV